MNRFHQGTLEDWKNTPQETREAIADLWYRSSKETPFDMLKDMVTTLVSPITRLVNSYRASTTHPLKANSLNDSDSREITKNSDTIIKIYEGYSSLEGLFQKYSLR